MELVRIYSRLSTAGSTTSGRLTFSGSAVVPALANQPLRLPWSLSWRRKDGSLLASSASAVMPASEIQVLSGAASDFARFNADVRGSLIDFLNGPRMRAADIKLHFDCLIKGPLSKHQERLSTGPQPVVVLDALDE